MDCYDKPETECYETRVVIPVFTQPDPLPRAQSDTSITNGKCQIGAQETRLGVGGHVVRALAAVLPWYRLRHQSLIKIFTIIEIILEDPQIHTC